MGRILVKRVRLQLLIIHQGDIPLQFENVVMEKLECDLRLPAPSHPSHHKHSRAWDIGRKEIDKFLELLFTSSELS
jgi:hypothetical protein